MYLKPGDIFTVLCEVHLYNRVGDVFQMMEQILACGIILCFYGKNFSTIQSVELLELRKLVEWTCLRNKKRYSFGGISPV